MRRVPLLLAAGLAALAMGSPARADAAVRIYVALGDSVAVMRDSYVAHYHRYLRDPARGDVDRVVNLSRGGETSASMRAPGGQLDRAVRAIGRTSDVVVVTLDIGGNDGLTGQCLAGFNRDPCPFKPNYGAILTSLAGALASDPGRESFQVMAYYNPLAGTGSPLASTYDHGLLGSDLRLGCSGAGDELGLNDFIACLGEDAGGEVVDTYETFRAAGAGFILDGIHPTDAGHRAIACLFAHPDRAGSADPCGELVLSASRDQRVLVQHGATVTVATRSAATVALSAIVRIPGPPADVRLRVAHADLAAGQRRTVQLRLRGADATRLRRSLRLHRTLSARVSAAAKARTGRTHRDRMTIRLIR
jgi:hypothetical protein